MAEFETDTPEVDEWPFCNQGLAETCTTLLSLEKLNIAMLAQGLTDLEYLRHSLTLSLTYPFIWKNWEETKVDLNSAQEFQATEPMQVGQVRLTIMEGWMCQRLCWEETVLLMQ